MKTEKIVKRFLKLILVIFSLPPGPEPFTDLSGKDEDEDLKKNVNGVSDMVVDQFNDLKRRYSGDVAGEPPISKSLYTVFIRHLIVSLFHESLFFCFK
jgi:hypothetical protein